MCSVSCREAATPNEDNINPSNSKNTPGWFYSDFLSGNRYIYVRLPSDYHENEVKKYHAAYLLDGNWYFDERGTRIENGGVSGIIDRLVQEGAMPDIILVGIGNFNENGTSTRGLDFHSDKTINFYQFITDELIPCIDDRFNTDRSHLTGRTLIGHSSAAYFTMYAFFQYDSISRNVFHNFIVLSGDFNKPFINLYDEEFSFFERTGTNGQVDMALFLGVGGLEEERFLFSYHTMKDLLYSRNYRNFRQFNRLYPDHDHGSYIAEAIREGLLLFGSSFPNF